MVGNHRANLASIPHLGQMSTAASESHFTGRAIVNPDPAADEQLEQYMYMPTDQWLISPFKSYPNTNRIIASTGDHIGLESVIQASKVDREPAVYTIGSQGAVEKHYITPI